MKKIKSNIKPVKKEKICTLHKNNKYKKAKLNLLFLKLKGLFRHTLVSHVHTTLLNTAVIIVIRDCLSILQLNAEPPLLGLHVGNHVRFDHSQKKEKIYENGKEIILSNAKKSHIKISYPRFTRHSGCVLHSVNILSYY